MFIKPEDFTARLEEVHHLVGDTYSYTFKVVDGNYEYKAGQFAMIKFDDPDGSEEELQRAYSVASAPDGDHFEFCIELFEDGKGSRYINGLKVGDEVSMKGPFGLCFIKDDNHNDLVMVATGTGIAPVKGILEDMLNKNDQRQIDVFFGVRHEKDLFYVEELKELESGLANMKLNVCLSQPETDEWDGLRGRVTAHVPECDLSNNPDFYICGGGAMIKEVRQIALDKGVDRKKIHVEIFDI